MAEAPLATLFGYSSAIRSLSQGRANSTMEPIHDRMPVILDEADWAQWLDPANDDLDTLGKLLVPAPPKLIEVFPVGTDVNNVRNNGPELIARVDPATGEIHGQGTLL